MAQSVIKMPKIEIDLIECEGPVKIDKEKVTIFVVQVDENGAEVLFKKLDPNVRETVFQILDNSIKTFKEKMRS